jgi:hypothetical protein
MPENRYFDPKYPCLSVAVKGRRCLRLAGYILVGLALMTLKLKACMLVGFYGDFF